MFQSPSIAQPMICRQYDENAHNEPTNPFVAHKPTKIERKDNKKNGGKPLSEKH